MFHQAHIVDVGVGLGGLGHEDGVIPEAEAIDAAGALGDGEERFSIHALDARGHQEPAFVEDGAGVEDGVDAHALEEKGIGLLVQVVAPQDGRVRGGEYRVLVAIEDSVAAGRLGAAASQKPLLLPHEAVHLLLKCRLIHLGSPVQFNY